MTGYKTHRSKKAMQASETHWKWCKENNIDIWNTKLTRGEL